MNYSKTANHMTGKSCVNGLHKESHIIRKKKKGKTALKILLLLSDQKVHWTPTSVE